MSLPTTTIDALTLARSVIPSYAAVYSDAHVLVGALENRSPASVVEPQMRAASELAEAYALKAEAGEDGADESDGRYEALFRAADAVEAVWLALQPVEDAEYFEDCVDAALNGRPEINLRIWDEKRQKWV